MIGQKTVIHLARRSDPDIGGVESHLSHVLPELEKLGFNAVILNERTLQKNLAWVPSHKLAIWLGMLFRLPILWRASILHVHDVFWWLLPLLPLLWWKQIFITFHGYESVAGPSLRQRFWHRLAAWITRGNICIGRFHEAWYGVKSKSISYGAVGIAEKKSKCSQNKQAVFIGRLALDTNFRTYVEAIYLAKQKGTQISLAVYGEGSERAWAEVYAKRHHLDIDFFGFVPNAISHIEKYSCAFVSQYLAILESLAAGVPVVACATTKFKKSYLQDTPFASWITLATTPAEIVTAFSNRTLPSARAQAWSRAQSWKKLALQYQKLWSTR